MRRANWLETKLQVERWNSEGHSSQQAVNHLADWTAEERSSLTMDPKILGMGRSGDLIEYQAKCQDYLGQLINSIDPLPKALSWRGTNRVGAVKDQGTCGSCWAFAATGLLEGQFKGDSPPVSLSEQQLIDCDGNSGGCCGYYMNGVLGYLVKAGGIQAGSTYPYQFRHDECKFNANKVVATVDNFCMFEGADAIKVLVANYGPVAVYMYASDKFMIHGRGIYDGSRDCKENVANHVVLIVGYGNDNGTDYWIAKNSWGSKWGDAGFFKIRRGVNMCMIEHDVFIANISIPLQSSQSRASWPSDS